MNEFMGIKNVVDAIAILGKDGVTEGFRIIYQEPRQVKYGKKTFQKMIEKQVVKYIREPEIENDGSIHGFGKGVVYASSTGKRRSKKQIKMTASGLASVARALGK